MIPALDDLRAAHARLAPHVVRTPTLPCYGNALAEAFGGELWLKMELLQRTGSFKARGALNVALALSQDERRAGVAAVSAGNHAIAAAWAAREAGTSCKVVMPRTANPFRAERVRALGAEIVPGDTMGDLFALYETLLADEGRAPIHPFEGPRTFEGTAGVGLEMAEDVEGLDAVVVPVGGGGLISGIAAALHHVSPGTQVFGVEPEGACGMAQSLERGEPLARVEVSSIADSLSAPLHLPQSFGIVRDLVTDMVTVSEDEMRAAMRLAFTDLKLALEPACAAGVAALLGPLHERLAGRRVGLVLCGSNIDPVTWARVAQIDATVNRA